MERLQIRKFCRQLTKKSSLKYHMTPNDQSNANYTQANGH